MAAKKRRGATPPGELSKYQAFVMERMKRSDIKGAPYNPRQIDNHAKSRLELFLKKRGLLAPVTVNRPTGNLVGGHQRLAALDVLEGHADYLLDVAMVVLSDAEEREANIFLNNPGAQGSWDLNALGELLKETPDLDLEMTGFVPMDLEVMFADTELASLYTPDAATAEDIATLEAMGHEPKPRSDKERKKAERKSWNEGYDEAKVTAPYAVIIFKTHEEREAFFDLVGHPLDERHIDAQLVLARMKKPARKTGN